ncbi:hypothetical protein RF11_04991 [Thelohanellus kitauei]|uniref:Uncharacterized protein n=1 Tax=Thelohanellus kitauei TaxID=669202 RepID=A0A0C2ID87_THEKT|nr:hypothetical protein RF11_04991 [Thelohanellus kitauei]
MSCSLRHIFEKDGNYFSCCTCMLNIKLFHFRRYSSFLCSQITWNKFESATEGIARTTNAVEGWHCGLQSLFMCSHPTMWTLFEGLKKDSCKQKTIYLQTTSGVEHHSSKKYRELQAKVLRAVTNYGRTNLAILFDKLNSTAERRFLGLNKSGCGVATKQQKRVDLEKYSQLRDVGKLNFIKDLEQQQLLFWQYYSYKRKSRHEAPPNES